MIRLLRIGIQDLNTFYEIMDLAAQFYSETYYKSENIHITSKAVYELLIKKTIKKKKNDFKKEEELTHLTVSGDGSWKKKGHIIWYYNIIIWYYNIII